MSAGPRNLLANFKGLVTAPGMLLRDPASASLLRNWTVDAPGMLRKRRGLGFTSTNPMTSPVSRVWLDDGPARARFFALQDDLLTVGATFFTGTSQVVSGFWDGVAITISSIGSRSVRPIPFYDLTTAIFFAMPGAKQVNQAAALGCQYLAGLAQGPRRIEAVSSVRYAGMPRGRPIDTYNMVGAGGGAYDVLTGAPGTLLPDGWARAYRVTWHRATSTSFGNELGGAPTGRMVIRNATGTSGYAAAVTKNVAQRIPLPKEFGTTDEFSGGSAGTALTTDYYYRVWATRTWNTATDTGDDECYLVTEQFVTGGDIAAGYATYTDSTPDAFLLGSPKLHTNTIDFPVAEANLGQGQLNADEAPPIARCMAYWRDSMWYGNNTARPQILLTQLALPANNATYADGVVTITAKNAPAAATDFQIVNTLATITLNIEATARNFCEVYNRQANAAGYAYYISLGNQIPGLILIEYRNLRDQDSAGKFATLTLSTAPASNATYRQIAGFSAVGNQLVYSKPQRPDAVAPVNALAVGPPGTTILALAPYRDRLFVFTDVGVFHVRGTSAFDFVCDIFDDTTHLIAPGTVCSLGDSVFAWCIEGIVEFSSSGAQIISESITPTLEDIYRTLDTAKPSNAGATLSAAWPLWMGLQAFATADTRFKRVRFFYPEDPSFTGTSTCTPTHQGCVKSLVWDAKTRTWSQESYGEGDDNLRLRDGIFSQRDVRNYYVSAYGQAGDTFLWYERYDYAATDFSDLTVIQDEISINSLMQLALQVPDLAALEHWQQTLLLFEDALDGFQWRPRPSRVFLSYYDTRNPSPPEIAGASAQFTLLEPRVRAETPSDFRYSNRLGLAIQHSDAEYAGLYGIFITAGPRGEFGTK